MRSYDRSIDATLRERVKYVRSVSSVVNETSIRVIFDTRFLFEYSVHSRSKIDYDKYCTCFKTGSVV